MQQSLVIGALVLLFVGSNSAFAQKPVPHTVISVDGVMEVMEKSAVKDFKKQKDVEHKDKVRAWKDAKKAAKKDKKKFTDKKPKKPAIKSLGSFKSKDLAEAFVKRENEKRAKKKKKKSKDDS